jgi:predicted TIM-barrel fold metal-dependent hydrolase
VRIIDTHVHLYDGGWPPETATGLTNRQMLDLMDGLGVEQVWVSPVSGLIRDFQEFNNDLFEFTRIAPGRLRPFYVVNPVYLDEAIAELDRVAGAMGADGLKLHPWLQAFSVTYPCVDRVVEACVRHELPILFHDGTPPYSDSLQVASLAERFPEAKIILGHAGLYDGYRSAIAAAKRHKNIYLCVCGPAIADTRAMIATLGPERILYGSDGGKLVSKTTFVQRIKLIREAAQDEKIARQILEENPRALVP